MYKPRGIIEGENPDVGMVITTDFLPMSPPLQHSPDVKHNIILCSELTHFKASKSTEQRECFPPLKIWIVI